MAARIGTVRTAPREVRGPNTRELFIVQLVEGGVMIKLKGKRTWFGPVSYDAIYSLGAKLEAGVGSLTRPRRKV